MLAMETAPAVRYVRTHDGMSIAYSVAGEGPAAVVLPFHHNHIEMRWSARYSWIRDVAASHRVVFFDSRGQGLSTRSLTHQPTIEDYGTDLKSVIEAARLDRFALIAYGGFAHVAIEYAVENPARVTALVLICTAESHAAWPQAAWVSLAEQNWDLFLELEIRSDLTPGAMAAFINLCKAGATQPDYVKMVRCFAASDVSKLLPRLNLPTLLLHSRNQHWLSPEEGTRLAAKVSGARIVFLDGGLEPDAVQGVRAIAAFLDEVAAGASSGERHAAMASKVALSPRQAEILRLIAAGKTTREIADELVLSQRTIERHISDLYTRTGVRNRAEATALALQG
jgi:pimeloyl-ACP methyl ester carboxylesterase/DNA-binding CsgD family transcriptional regulator